MRHRATRLISYFLGFVIFVLFVYWPGEDGFATSLSPEMFLKRREKRNKMWDTDNEVGMEKEVQFKLKIGDIVKGNTDVCILDSLLMKIS